MKNINLSLSGITATLFAIMVSLSFISLIACNSKPPKNSLVAQTQRGKALFLENCVQCHGENARGLKIDSVKVLAADLTKIKRSRGLREFPILEIANIIDGRKVMGTHEERVMPKWGEEFSQDGQLTEDDIKGKMAELIAYLMTIQE